MENILINYKNPDVNKSSTKIKLNEFNKLKRLDVQSNSNVKLPCIIPNNNKQRQRENSSINHKIRSISSNLRINLKNNKEKPQLQNININVGVI